MKFNKKVKESAASITIIAVLGGAGFWMGAYVESIKCNLKEIRIENEHQESLRSQEELYNNLPFESLIELEKKKRAIKEFFKNRSLENEKDSIK